MVFHHEQKFHYVKTCLPVKLYFQPSSIATFYFQTFSMHINQMTHISFHYSQVITFFLKYYNNVMNNLSLFSINGSGPDIYFTLKCWSKKYSLTDLYARQENLVSKILSRCKNIWAEFFFSFFQETSNENRIPWHISSSGGGWGSMSSRWIWILPAVTI